MKVEYNWWSMVCAIKGKDSGHKERLGPSGDIRREERGKSLGVVLKSGPRSDVIFAPLGICGMRLS